MIEPLRTSVPRTADLEQALARLGRADRLLVAMDFDGTIAPEADRPELARALPEARAALIDLARMPRTWVAIVSGRSLGSLKHVGDFPPEFLLVGSHGVEIEVGGRLLVDEPVTRDELVVLETLAAVLELIAAEAPGAWVEAKPFGQVLHTRLCEPTVAAAAQQSALDTVGSGLPGMRVRKGKNVLEFAVRQQTKGDALELLRHTVAADSIIYAGDDVTDEDAFAVLGDADVSVHSGTGPTLAHFTVDGPDEVAGMLVTLAAGRAAADGR